MALSFRVASFNVENLFARAKLLNFEDNAAADPYLKKVDELRKALSQKTYDKPSILKLYKELQDYIDIVEVREKLFDSFKKKVVANGVGEWSGFIQFKREKFSDEARTNTAKVIEAVNAEVFCLVEVESRPVLKNFSADKLPSGGTFKEYPHLMLVDGNDPRGIDVALMSRYPIGNMRSHIDDEDATGIIFSRDCLELEVSLPDGRSLFVLLNHFKSKGGGGTQASSNAKRLRQATKVAAILQRFDLTQDLVVVCGDFNDTPGSAPLQPVLAAPHLSDVLAAHFQNAAERWTYHYKKNEQIDYILVSGPMRQGLTAAGVERRGMFGVDQFSGGTIQPFPTVTGKKASASDHGAVWADFSL
jgi:endonuclease/exonuclease/phosphatase family metal-dependent hydrolase